MSKSLTSPKRDSKTLRSTKHNSKHKRTTSDWSRLISSIFDANNKKTQTTDHVVDAEALTREERLSRLLHTPKPTTTIPKTGPLLDYFLVVGVNDCKDEQPKILFSYPPNIEVNLPGIEDFCFPEGIKSEPVKPSPSVITDSRKPGDSFVFLLTDENKVVYYGICVQKQELFEDVPSYMEQFDIPADSRSMLTKRCYCMISKFPFFRFHVDFVENVCLLDYDLRSNKNLGGDQPQHFISPPRPMLSKIQRREMSKSDSYLCDVEKKELEDFSLSISSGETSPPSSPPLSPPRSNKTTSPSPLRKISSPKIDDHLKSHSELNLVLSDLSEIFEPNESAQLRNSNNNNNNNNNNVDSNDSESSEVQNNNVITTIERLREIDIPTQGQTLSFIITNNLKPLVYRRPFFDEEEEIFADWGLPLTFFNFSFQNIASILSAILLERKVVFYSTNLRFLSSFVLAFSPLIKPFEYQSVVITNLPRKMFSFLDAPVPFVVGIASLPEDLPSDIVLIDVAKKTIKSTEAIPVLPKFNELKKKSSTYVNQLKKTFSDASPPYTTSKEQSFLVESISTVFVNHFSTLFSNFHMYTIRDLTDPEKPITVFMKESFLYDMPDSSFFSPFLSSQIFFDYSDKRLRKRDKEGKK